MNSKIIAISLIAVLSMVVVVSALQPIFAPSSRRWAVVEGERFQFTGFHHFNDGTVEKVDVTCVAKGMPTEPAQTVTMDCTPLNIYGHTPT